MEAIIDTATSPPGATAPPGRADSAATTAAVDPSQLTLGLTLRFEPSGLTVVGVEAASNRTAPWATVLGLRFGRSGVLPDGTLAVSLSAVVSGWSVRWWIPWSEIRSSEVGSLDRLARRLVPVGHERVPFRWTVRILSLAIVALVVAGAIVLVVDLARSTPSPNRGAAPPSGTGDRVLAADINVDRTDFPNGWTVDSSANGPLNSFLGGSGGAARPSPAQQREIDRVGRQYESCMGLPPSQDRFFGPASSRPVVQVSSPAFAAPSTAVALEAGSQTAIYRSAATVQADLNQIGDQRFPSCFGGAIGTEFVDALAKAAGQSGATYGTPTVKRLTLPQRGKASAVGVDLTLPIAAGGRSTTLQFGFAFVGGGRVESSLVTFATPSGFPAALSGRLTAALERKLLAAGSATGA